MPLKSAIEAWDGQSASALCRIHDEFKESPEFVMDLVELMGSLRYRPAATRLLKRHLDAGLPVPDRPALARALAGKLDKIEHWECRLNILQCLHDLPIDAECVPAVEHFLRICLAEDNKFVRAWAYSGFHHLAEQQPVFRTEADAILAAGLRDESASVKARIRKCLGGKIPAPANT